VTVRLAGACNLLYRQVYFPARTEIVEFHEPLRHADLEAFRYDSNPPEVKRVLAALDLDSPSWPDPYVTIAVDVSDVRFFGVKVRTPGLDYVCSAFGQITAVD
jgi:hypothetical protein